MLMFRQSQCETGLYGWRLVSVSYRDLVLFPPVMSMHPGALISLLILHPSCTVHPSPHVVVPIVAICQEMDLF
jgi:hypothetical protein